MPEKVVAVQDREKHNRPVYANKICKVFVQCRVIGGEFKENHETTGFDYFGIDELPPLATEKSIKSKFKCALMHIMTIIGKLCWIDL